MLSRFRTAIAIAAVAIAAFAATLLLRRPGGFGGTAEQLAYMPHQSPPPKFWAAPDVSFVDQSGKSVTRASLLGRPYIADFIFTQCTNACPMMTSRMVLLQRALADIDVAFVSFSVDPAHDSSAALAAYARSWNASETRWLLVATDQKRLPDLLAGYHVTAKPSEQADNPIIHSDVFLLVDAEGSVRGAYDSSDDAAKKQLMADARLLAQPRAANAAGGPLYTSLGCAGCHDNARIAPPLSNLTNGERMLTDGRRVEVDDAYLRKSIVEPGADLVMGYAPLMPSYKLQLGAGELDRLVDELKARHSDAPPVADAKLVVDPVCHMTVRTDPSAIHVGEHYFCSEACRDKFVANPEKYGAKK